MLLYSQHGDVPALLPLSAAAAKIYLQMFLLLGGRIICSLFVRLPFVLVTLTRWVNRPRM